ncbi:hypothetical protein BRN20_01190, partial [Xanthomonas oryzae pv. oryzae]
THADGIVPIGQGGWMTWATPLGGEVAQVRSPGPRHNRWCCDPELKPPPADHGGPDWRIGYRGRYA